MKTAMTEKDFERISEVFDPEWEVMYQNINHPETIYLVTDFVDWLSLRYLMETYMLNISTPEFYENKHEHYIKVIITKYK